MSSALERLKNLASDLPAKIASYEIARKENLNRLRKLYEELHIDEKTARFEDIFEFKAINLSGVSLDSATLGAIKPKRYVQIIAISYDGSAAVKNKNSSLGYFGRAEKLDERLKKRIVSFILSWRFEKSFRTLEHYHNMLGALQKDA